MEMASRLFSSLNFSSRREINESAADDEVDGFVLVEDLACNKPISKPLTTDLPPSYNDTTKLEPADASNLLNNLQELDVKSDVHPTYNDIPVVLASKLVTRQCVQRIVNETESVLRSSNFTSICEADYDFHVEKAFLDEFIDHSIVHSNNSNY